MKKVLIVIAILLITTAIVFAIPAIPVPVQRIETYTETVTKQEPYIVKEKQDVSVPHTFRPFKSKVEFTGKDKIWYLGFLVVQSDMLCQKCTCDYSERVGHVDVGTKKYICVPPDAKIRVTWTVDEDERGKMGNELKSCPPHYGFTSDLVIEPVYWIDKSSWEGELEFPAGWYSPVFYLRYGYDNLSCSKTPAVNNTIDIIWYTTEIVDKDVTRYRDVQVQVEKQRTITDYQSVSVWQRIFAK